MSSAEVLLAFDYGEARIGVAIGNTLTQQARALTILENTTVVLRFQRIAQLIETWQPSKLIVGLPRYADGQAHHMTQRATRFGNQLHGRFKLPVVWIDERYSSTAARSALSLSPTIKSKESGAVRDRAVDAEAARIILQQFFDSGEN